MLINYPAEEKFTYSILLLPMLTEQRLDVFVNFILCIVIEGRHKRPSLSISSLCNFMQRIYHESGQTRQIILKRNPIRVIWPTTRRINLIQKINADIAYIQTLLLPVVTKMTFTFSVCPNFLGNRTLIRNSKQRIEVQNPSLYWNLYVLST